MNIIVAHLGPTHWMTYKSSSPLGETMQLSSCHSHSETFETSRPRGRSVPICTPVPLVRPQKGPWPGNVLVHLTSWRHVYKEHVVLFGYVTDTGGVCTNPTSELIVVNVRYTRETQAKLSSVARCTATRQHNTLRHMCAPTSDSTTLATHYYLLSFSVPPRLYSHNNDNGQRLVAWRGEFVLKILTVILCSLWWMVAVRISVGGS